MEKYKILYLDHAPFIGGGQLALLRHLRNLDKNIFTPYVITSNGNPEWISSISKDAILFPLPIPKLKVFIILSIIRLIRVGFSLCRIVSKVNPDLLVINSERMLYPSVMVSRILSKKSVLWLRDFEYNRTILRLIVPFLSGVICVSRSVCRFFGGLNNNKFKVIYVGTEVFPINENDGAVASFRRKIGAFGDSFLIGFAGRLVKWKGVAVLLGACKLLENDPDLIGSDWKVVIAGTGSGQLGDNESSLKKYSKENLQQGRVSFLGHYVDMVTFNKAIDVFVHPSIAPEPFATVIVDAMGVGKIVIASAIGGTPELIENGKNGFLFTPGDECALYSLLKRIILKQLTAESLAGIRKEAVEKIVSEFTEEKVTKEVMEYFKEILMR